MPAPEFERKEPSLDPGEAAVQSNPYSPPRSQVEARPVTGKLLPHQKAGRVIRLMAWLGVAAVVGIGVAVLLPAVSGGRALPMALVAPLAFCSVLVAALFLVGRAVMKRAAWGRWAGIVYGLVSLIGFPLGTLIGAYILWQLVFGWAEGAAEA